MGRMNQVKHGRCAGLIRRLHKGRHSKGYWVNIFNPIQNIGRTTQAKV